MAAGGATGSQKFKVVLLGDSAVGKTSLIIRYLKNTFDDKVEGTIGMDFQSKTVQVGDRSVRLQLWDTAGQERFRSLVKSYIRDAAAAVIVYDLTQRKSFESTKGWVEEVRNVRGKEVLLVLVGNKLDMSGERAISTAEGQQLANEVGAHFAEMSAKSGENVAELFNWLAAELPTQAVVAAQAAQGAAQGGAENLRLGAAAAAVAAGEASESKKKCNC